MGNRIAKSWLILCAGVLLGAGTAAQAAEPAGTVKKLSGEAQLERAGEKLPITVGTPVMAMDRVTTGAGGSVGITLKDDTLLSAGPNSSIVVEQFSFNPATHDGNLALRVIRGTLAAVSGLIARARPASVVVRTPTVTAGVRGTEFLIEVPAND